MDERTAIQQLIHAGDLPTRDKIDHLMSDTKIQIQDIVQTGNAPSIEILQKADTTAQKFLVKDFTSYLEIVTSLSKICWLIDQKLKEQYLSPKQKYTIRQH